MPEREREREIDTLRAAVKRPRRLRMFFRSHPRDECGPRMGWSTLRCSTWHDFVRFQVEITMVRFVLSNLS